MHSILRETEYNILKYRIAQKFNVIKLYGLPLNHLDKKLMHFNFTESQFMLIVMAIYLVDFHAVYGF